MQRESKGHVCFARRTGGTWVTCKVLEAHAEFVVDESGAILASCLMDAPMLKATGQRAWDYIHCMRAGLVAAFCKNMGCDVPQATAERVKYERSVAKTEREKQKAHAAQRLKEYHMAKGKKSEKTIVGTWDELFQQNEERYAKHQRTHETRDKPWTDDQLVEKMVAEFPDHKGKTTLTRPRMFRACYNAGTFMFEKLGSAKSRKLPESQIYGKDGKPVPKGTRRATIEAGGHPGQGKKAGGRSDRPGQPKKVVRRAGKAGVKRAGNLQH